MKHIILALAVIVVLPCCVTTKTTAPDGTVTETRAIDHNALAFGERVSLAIIDRTSNK